MTREGQIDIYNEVDNFVEENMGEVTHTEIARHFFELGRNNAIDKACKWLKDYAHMYVSETTGDLNEGDLINAFRKAMEGECYDKRRRNQKAIV